MSVFCNGEFLCEDDARVSVFDRSFLYGDGLFETLRVCRGTPFRWEQHWDRLRRGAEFLGISIPFSAKRLEEFSCELIARERHSNALLRITISRGDGGSGYSPRGAESPLVLMWLRPAPEVDPHRPVTWRVVTSVQRVLADSPLTQFKTANKLVQVLARKEAERAGVNEALILNSRGEIAEGAASNIFWIDQEGLGTPPLSSGALDGVTRSVVLEHCRELGVPWREAPIRPERLGRARGVFFTLSSLGLVEAVELDRIPLGRADLVTRLHQAYQARQAAATV